MCRLSGDFESARRALSTDSLSCCKVGIVIWNLFFSARFLKDFCLIKRSMTSLYLLIIHGRQLYSTVSLYGLPLTHNPLEALHAFQRRAWHSMDLTRSL